MKNLFLLFLPLFCLFSCKASQSAKNSAPYVHEINQDSLTQKLQEYADKDLLPGFVCSVFTQDSVLYKKGFGYADIEEKRPYTTQTVQIIASISKTFTGFALMKAVEEGKLDLDADVNDYLPFEIRNPHYPKQIITLRHLATHTSGLDEQDMYRKGYAFIEPLNWDDFPEVWHPLLADYDNNSFMEMEEFLLKLARKGGEWYDEKMYLNSKPGKKFSYSNLGAALAGYITARAMKEDFRKLTTAQLLRPLQMEKSTWYLEEVDTQLHTTYYLENKNPVPPYHVLTYPDGGLYSNVDDLTKYMQEMMRGYYGNGTLLKKETYQEMMRQQFKGKDRMQGLFWDLEIPPFVGHAGNDFGTATLMYLHPEKKIGAILFTNISLEKEELADAFYSMFGVLFR